MKRHSRIRKAAKLSKSIQGQLSMYAIAASAAGVGMLALAQPAEARIIYTETYQFVPSYGMLPLYLNHDNTVDFGLSHFSTNDAAVLTVCGPSSQGFVGSCWAGDQQGTNQILGYGGSASALRAGARISSTKRFEHNLLMAGLHRYGTSCPRPAGSCVVGRWNEKTDRYLGLKFIIKGKIHYGWARLNVGKGGYPAVLTGFAYETIPGKAIIAGKTKGPDVIAAQPASLGRLAQGSAKLTARRLGN